MSRKICQLAVLLMCSTVVACSAHKESAEPVVYRDASKNANSVVYKDKNTTNDSQWMIDKEAALRESIAGTPFTLRKQGSALVVTVQADQSFNPVRPAFLLPVSLRPITKIAKLLQANPDSAVLILGHTDMSASDKDNYELSSNRARAVASIFRLSGLSGQRMSHFGLGGSHLLPAQKIAKNNHRVEIIVTQHAEFQDVMAVYKPAHVRQLALSQGQ